MAGAFTLFIALAVPENDFRDPGTGAWDIGLLLAWWGGYTILALPVGFVVGLISLVAARSLRGRASFRGAAGCSGSATETNAGDRLADSR
jgi:hypothetical protein